MTANEAMSEFGMYSPNTLDEALKYKWLSNAERHVVEILDSYEGNEHEAVELSPETDGDYELKAREPYSELYKYYLLAQINLLYGDTAKYNVFASLYENELDRFRYWCVRKYRSKNENSQIGVI